ncbi:glycosyltransferase 87 family protein [Microlunatus sp. Gsoil 973]|uniref:glycosyltransferase 87 family protein n=1 Tax=Microlunatus sp. Gsoil 973 TaxID=2672569 RepID=UPI0012B4FDB4|nr:glycosyltransferase 87 family protein [Microlunatus sp. Gsoil 973]QGN33151.1 DUF2029 domain-containing protein [Microlunatus sp. Gsoil 973]
MPAQHGSNSGRAALVLIAVSIVVVLVVGAFGPTAAQAELPGGPAWLPPYGFGVDPGPMVVTVVLMAAVLVGGAGLFVALSALERGWRPDVRRLTWIGVASTVAMVLVGPMGSTDVLIYAGYGRLAATGGNPYIDTVRELITGRDPVGIANIGIRWVDTTSVYGPIMSGVQTVGSLIGGSSVHTTVFVYTAFGAVCYLITGLLLRRMAGADQLRQARVALLWTVNPVLLFIAVNSGHADTIGIMFVAGALLALSRRRWIIVGVLLGMACAVKITFGIAVLAVIIVLRRQPRRLAVVLVSGLVVGAISYLIAGPEAIRSTLLATGKYASASPLRWPLYPLSEVVGLRRGVTIIVATGWLLMLVYGLLFHKLMPAQQVVTGSVTPGEPGATGDRQDLLGQLVPVLSALGIGWALTSAYTLPWYDVLGWAPLTLVVGAPLVDRVLTIRTTALICAYLPGAAYYFPPAVQLLTDGARNVMGPAVSLMLMAVVVVAVVRRRSAGRAAPEAVTPPPSDTP